jgi:hypothetical protein
MAVLSSQDRFDLWAAYMRHDPIDLSNTSLPGDLSKVDLRAVANAMDQWVSDNAAAFNAALPEPGKSSMTAAQKSALFMYVVAKRYQRGT